MTKKSLHTTPMLESEEDFGVAYEAHSQPIFRFFYWRTRDVQLSEDLTSSVFEKAWQSRRSFRGGSVRAWLYRIARNRLIDHWRSKQTLALENEDSLLSDHETAADTIDRQLLRQQLSQALDTLPAEARIIVQLRFVEGLSAKRVAQIVGKSEGNVRIIQYRALQKMRHYLDEK